MAGDSTVGTEERLTIHRQGPKMPQICADVRNLRALGSAELELGRDHDRDAAEMICGHLRPRRKNQASTRLTE
jgi:hypothetical protein